MQLAKETRTPTSLRSAFHVRNASRCFLCFSNSGLNTASLSFPSIRNSSTEYLIRR